MATPPTPIGIAIVEHDGRYLVGIRGEDGPLPGYAEFPGGKCEPNESPAECACRECLEETGLAVVVERLLLRREFDYPYGTVDLHFWLCRPAQPKTVADAHRGFRWIAGHELPSLRFPEANAPVIDMLVNDT